MTWTPERRAAHSAKIKALHAQAGGAYAARKHPQAPTSEEQDARRERHRDAQARYRLRKLGIAPGPWPDVATIAAQLAKAPGQPERGSRRNAGVVAVLPGVHPLAHLYRIEEPPDLPKDDPRYWQPATRRERASAPSYDPDQLAEVLAQAGERAIHVPAGVSGSTRSGRQNPDQRPL